MGLFDVPSGCKWKIQNNFTDKMFVKFYSKRAISSVKDQDDPAEEARHKTRILNQHCTSKTQERERIFKLASIHALLICQIPSI